jgi:two-component system sensor histidine kinase RegB
MEREAEKLPGGEGLRQDAELIREELERCRLVLDRMAAAGGEHVGEALSIVPVDELVDEVRSRLGEDRGARWAVTSNVDAIEAPREALVQMVENIARNGFDACETGQVALAIASADGSVELRFSDEGRGMDPDVLRRATDPFFTTKDSDDRMGLGLFLARTLVDSLGGRLTIDSESGRGTTIVAVLPQRA